MTFGVRTFVLGWFAYYIHYCNQSANGDGTVPAPILLVYGVPQGSILGPVLFTPYSQLLSGVISDYEYNFHKYADDTQLSQSEFRSVQSGN